MRRVILALVTTAAGLTALLSYKTPGLTNLAATPTTQQQPLVPGPAGTPQQGGGNNGTGGATGTRVFNGPVVRHDYGPVQVQVVVTGGQLRRVTPVQLPTDNPMSLQIDRTAVPTLGTEAL